MYANPPGYIRRPASNNFGHPNCSREGQTNGSVNGRPERPSNEIPDVLVQQFFDDQIIQTINRDNDIVYYCFYCANNIKDLSKVAKHVTDTHHIQMKNSKRYDKGLNKKFVIKSVDERGVEYLSDNERREMIVQELDRIPNDAKHYFCRRGIRLMNCIGEYAYYCKTCEQPISSFTVIRNHLRSESHLKLENRESLFDYVNDHELKKNTIPITGLKFVTEYQNQSLTEMLYKCNICQYFDNAYKMYLHLVSYEHRLNLVNRLEETNNGNLCEDELNHILNAYKSRDGLGFVFKTKDMPVVYGTDWTQNLEHIRAIFGSVRTKTCDSMEQLFSVRIRNEFEANAVVNVIEKIKEATVKYYSNRNRDFQ